MTTAIRAITRLVDADDVNVTPGVGVDEYALCWDNDTARFVLRGLPTVITDHGGLSGLTDDDHSQYLLASGARAGAVAQKQELTLGLNIPVGGSQTWHAKGTLDENGLAWVDGAKKLTIKTGYDVYGLYVATYGSTGGDPDYAASISGAKSGLIVSGGTVWSLVLANAPVNGGSQRYTALADATAATDALNQQTGDARYAPIAGSLARIGNGAMQYQVPVTGATPFTPVWSGFLLDGTSGGKTSFAVTNTKTLTLTSTGDYNLTIPATGTVALLNQANSFTLINPLTTIAESWIGPSNTGGIYFKGGNYGLGMTNPGATTKLNLTLTTPNTTGLGLTGTITTASGSVYGANISVFSNPAGASAVTLIGIQGTARTNSANAQAHSGSIRGLNFNTIHQGTNTLAASYACDLIAVSGLVQYLARKRNVEMRCHGGRHRGAYQISVQTRGWHGKF